MLTPVSKYCARCTMAPRSWTGGEVEPLDWPRLTGSPGGGGEQQQFLFTPDAVRWHLRQHCAGEDKGCWPIWVAGGAIGPGARIVRFGTDHPEGTSAIDSCSRRNDPSSWARPGGQVVSLRREPKAVRVRGGPTTFTFTNSSTVLHKRVCSVSPYRVPPFAHVKHRCLDENTQGAMEWWKGSDR